jgi:hypothetical protein
MSGTPYTPYTYIYGTPYDPNGPVDTEQTISPTALKGSTAAFGGSTPQSMPGSAASYGQTAQQNYMQDVVNPQVSGVTSGFGGRGIGDSTFAGAFSAAAQADGAVNAAQVGNQAAEAYATGQNSLADANQANTNASLQPGYLADQQQQTANQNNYNMGVLGLEQQKVGNQANQFGQTLGYNYFNSAFGGNGF